uniref:Uncharacterized protein n=1 Tax=Arundo donax TaxID=35708 RepID=A0A0A9D8Z4_ARUDO
MAKATSRIFTPCKNLATFHDQCSMPDPTVYMIHIKNYTGLQWLWEEDISPAS